MSARATRRREESNNSVTTAKQWTFYGEQAPLTLAPTLPLALLPASVGWVHGLGDGRGCSASPLSSADTRYQFASVNVSALSSEVKKKEKKTAHPAPRLISHRANGVQEKFKGHTVRCGRQEDFRCWMRLARSQTQTLPLPAVLLVHTPENYTLGVGSFC